MVASPAPPEPDSTGATRAALRHALGMAIAQGADVEWREDHFNALALEIFRYQASANPVYGAFVRNRGLVPSELSDWRAIPPVPTRAFKELSLACEGSGTPEAVFRTSGTSLGTADRGSHPVRDLSLYRSSALAGACAFLRPELVVGVQPEAPLREDPARATTRPADSPADLRLLALLPAPEDLPDSSLASMAGALMAEWDDGGGGFFAEWDWTLRIDAFERALVRAAADGVPVLLIGTAFAFVHWLDRRDPSALRALPPGSRLMETGGFKGRSRVVARETLYHSLASTLGLDPGRMVNEYGMTELLSQFYEPVLREGAPESLASRWHVGPPWVRTLILDPRTLEPLSDGEVGLLCHVDLANLDSVAAILTEDQGVRVPGGIRLLGRIEGAEPRGCSISMEDLLRAREAVT